LASRSLSTSLESQLFKGSTLASAQQTHVRRDD
jgi:hypothetical protein